LEAVCEVKEARHKRSHMQNRDCHRDWGQWALWFLMVVLENFHFQFSFSTPFLLSSPPHFFPFPPSISFSSHPSSLFLATCFSSLLLLSFPSSSCLPLHKNKHSSSPYPFVESFYNQDGSRLAKTQDLLGRDNRLQAMLG